MIKEIPEAIMIHMPEDYFRESGYPELKTALFRRFYEAMGTAEGEDDRCFYHFIGHIPRHEVSRVYVCFHGFVQYKAIIVQFLRDSIGPGSQVPRNFIVTTGPVEKAPEGMIQKGFRGFRYSNHLF